MKQYIILLFTFSSVTFYAQSQHKSIAEDPIAQERIANGGKRTEHQMNVSEYFGLEKTIQEYSVTGKIPLSCPKSITYSDKNKYIGALNKWIKENPALIKEEKKNLSITE